MESKEFKGIKWSLGGCSGRLIKTNEYGGFVADVDTMKNALLIVKAPEMLDILREVNLSLLNDSSTIEQIELRQKIEELIKKVER